MNATAYRLPRPVLPVAYDVTLAASPRRRTFSGSLVCILAVKDPTATVELHARGLELDAVRARAGRRALDGQVEAHPERETVVLRFAEALPRGRATVTLDFAGQLDPGMHGLYLASDGHERTIASQCEATDARAIFPCFDEPDLKATLRWQVLTDPGLQVITNGVPTGRRSQRAPGARGERTVLHQFAPTRVISTYLAAVTIGDYQALPAASVGGIKARVWAGPGKKAQTRFAREVTAQVLPWYQRYFGQRYNYQKLDQVAVAGFDAGAMENVGAIFYRQSLLLMTPGSTSWGGQKRIAEVIAHELAHQWFGNLVTMVWWDDLWLNEAFATWMAYTACNAWRPEYRMWDDYLESKEGALAADALRSTHPIYTEVKSPAEATELFDVITYEKGCGVLRMAEAYLGAGTFRDGIRRYIKAFRNGNARGADLWAALGAAAGEDVGSLMTSWITQPGFPLLQVTLAHGRGAAKMVVSQRRFFADARTMAKADRDGQRWRVPIVYQHGDAKNVSTGRALLEREQASIPLPKAAGTTWIYPNAGATGFYRVQLDPEALAALLAHGLPHLAPGARMAVLEDQWALTRCGLAEIGQFMDVLAAYRGERDHAVVRTLTGRLHALQQAVAADADWPALARFCRWLLGPQLQTLGWAAKRGETPPHAVRRAAVVGALGEVGADPEVLRQAAALTAREMADPSAVEPNLAGTVIALAAQKGDAALMARYVATYRKRQRQGLAPQLGARYLGALSRFARPAVAKQVLAACLDGTVPQDQLRTVLGPMLASRRTQGAAWAFLQRHWAKLAPRVGAMGISRLVEATGALPPEQRDAVAQFFVDHPVPEAKRAVDKALEAMALRRALVARTAAPLGRWLSAATYDAA